MALVNNKFTPCKPSPNSVSSMEQSKKHFIEPFSYSGNLTAAFDKVIAIISRKENFKIVSKTNNYIHCTAATKLFQFIDDVEFYFPANEKLVHVKSTSRKGYYDFGANRRRIEMLRKLFNTKVL